MTFAQTFTKQKPSRLLSLDIFRGITIALMILVNSPGNHTAYAWLEHSSWNGCTLADIVFPFFVFTVGISSVFSLSKSVAQEIPLNSLLLKIFKRTIIIFVLGIFLNAFPNHFDFSTIRVFGVLQRIAICYFFSAFLFLTTNLRTQFLIFLGLLMGYWLIMILIPVPGYGVNNLTPEGNLASFVDRFIFSPDHLYGKIFDPEGLLSTLPAIATVLLGNLTGIWLLSQGTHQEKLRNLILIGIICLISGWVWGLTFPINKALWTSSYVLWTGGLALFFLAFCYWLIEIKKWKKWFKPFEIFGLNAIAAYFLHMFFLKVQAMIHVTSAEGSSTNLRIYISSHLFSYVDPQTASLMYAICYVIFWWIILSILYKKNIFIKI